MNRSTLMYIVFWLIGLVGQLAACGPQVARPRHLPMDLHFSVMNCLNRLIDCIIGQIDGLDRLIHGIVPMNGCNLPPSGGQLQLQRLPIIGHRWMVWSVVLRRAGRKLRCLGVSRWVGVPDDWFGRSTCGPPAASCPPWAITDDWAGFYQWIGNLMTIN